MKESEFLHSHTSFLQTTAKNPYMNLKEQTVASALVTRNIAQMKQGRVTDMVSKLLNARVRKTTS